MTGIRSPYGKKRAPAALSFRSLPRALLICVGLLVVVRLEAEDGASKEIKSPSQRLSELEERVGDLEGEVKRLEEEKRAAEAAADDADGAPFYADGVFTVAGVELRLGGRVDLLFVDTENFSDPIIGDTDEPDPYFEVNRFRIVPQLKFNRHIDARGQIDFSPERGRTRLREFSVRHRVTPVWWFRSNLRLGLDDRVIRQDRRTRTHSLAGNAFWRDETLGAVWSLRFGRSTGKPADEGVEEYTGEEDVLEGEALDYLKADNAGELYDEPVDPFDFSSNLGALTVHLSAGQGPVLNKKEIGRDNATFNDIVQDDRNIDDDQQFKEVGVALEYARDFSWLGELTTQGFFYHNTLGDESVEFLQGEDLTVRDNAGVPIAGYGDSDKRESWRYGFSVEYFFPASTLFGEEFTRRRDGLLLVGQWIKGEDGDFKREAWYVQGSYRYSFPERLIAGRYLSSVEPLVRYGELDTNLGPVIDLPTTWDRERLVVGLNIEITNEILLRGEYAFNSEDTGGSPHDVDNDELVVELRLAF